MHFRYSLLELARGKDPRQEGWVVNSGRTRYADELGPFPREYSDEEKELILKACASASLRRISKVCQFPDWLGYLGLVLVLARCEKQIYLKTATVWAWQLRELVHASSSASARLLACIAESNQLLSFSDLELVESALLEREYPSR